RPGAKDGAGTSRPAERPAVIEDRRSRAQPAAEGQGREPPTQMVLPDSGLRAWWGAPSKRQMHRGAVPRRVRAALHRAGGVVSTRSVEQMALNLEAKQAVVAEVSSVAESAQSAVVAEYRGLSASELTELRTVARGAGVYVKVVKNTLARRAVAGTSFECLQDSFKGP